jgi:hypothetical protein
MPSPFYFAVGVISVCAIWLVWEIAFRSVFLDGFRQRLFELRLYLFSLAEAGRISFDDEAYRMMEALLNALIRYAHRLSFTGYLYSARENARAKREDPDYIDFGNTLMLKISRLEPSVGAEVNKIVSNMHSALCIYMAANSLLFKIFGVIYLAKRLYRPNVKEEVKQRIFVVEREAYLSARKGSAYQA